MPHPRIQHAPVKKGEGAGAPFPPQANGGIFHKTKDWVEAAEEI